MSELYRLTDHIQNFVYIFCQWKMADILREKFSINDEGGFTV